MDALFDSHAHLALIKHATTEEILERAAAQGVSKMVSVSTDEASWKANQEHAQKRDGVFFSLGLHPHDSKNWENCAKTLESYFKDGMPPKKCVGIGEAGLDFHYNLSSREDQLHAFAEQVKLAKRVHLPIIIHCRDAFIELYGELKRIGMGDRTGIMHCFTGNRVEATQALDLGLKISFSGILTFKNAEALRDAAKSIPESEILVETDCPFLAPVPLRGKPNEPSFLPYTVAVLSELRGVSKSHMAGITFENAERVFGG